MNLSFSVFNSVFFVSSVAPPDCKSRKQHLIVKGLIKSAA